MAKEKKKRGCGGCFMWIVGLFAILFIGGLLINDDEPVQDEDVAADDVEEIVEDLNEGIVDDEEVEEEEIEEVVEVVEEEPEPEIEEEHEVEEENDEPRVIELGESLSFSEFTITFQNVTIEDDEATIHFLFRNDSWSDGLHFSRAAGFDVYQNDTLLDETSDVYNEYLGRNASVFYRHDVGIETPISMTYALDNEEDNIRIHIVVWMHEGVDEDEEFIIEIN